MAEINGLDLLDRTNRVGENTYVIEMASHVKVDRKESANEDWVLNGHNNLFFEYINDRYLGSPTNAALINAYTDRIYGKGLEVKRANLNADALAGVLRVLKPKQVKQVVHDFYKYGSAIIKVFYGKSTQRRIAKAVHEKRAEYAPGKRNETGDITHYYQSKNWQKAKVSPPKKYPAFGASKTASIEIFELTRELTAKEYFADPEYLPGLFYAELEEEIANFAINHIKSGLSAGNIIYFPNGEPDEEKKEDMTLRYTSALTGSNNAGKLILAFGQGQDEKPVLESFPHNENHEQWQFWADESRQQILVAHRVTTPMLFGVKDNTGLGNNANEMREGSKLLHETTIRPKQQEIIDGLQKLIAVNDISAPLRFIPLEDEEEREEKKGGVQEFSDKLADVAEFLVDLGEREPEEYEEVESRDFSSEMEFITADRLNTIIELATIDGDSRKASEHDTSLFKVRYKYTGSLSPQREFCKKLMTANKVYRFEDLKKAEDKAVNEGFGPGGSDKYNIFLYKGGVNCKHWWKRVIYLKKGNSRISVNRARKMILALDPRERNKARWPENDKKVAQIAGPSNDYWRVS